MKCEDLVTAVNELSSAGTPVVVAHRIKKWCNQNQIDGGENILGWNWKILDQASKEAQRKGQLQKWKSGSYQSAPVGWSLKDSSTLAKAKIWALDHGWKEKWDGTNDLVPY